jgi:hypothetical protein
VTAAAAVVLVTAFVAWPQPVRGPGPVAVRPVTPPPANGADDLPEAELLFDPPPVDPLDHLARQQDGYVAAMHQMKKE